MSVQGLDCIGVTECEFVQNNVATERSFNNGSSQVLTTGFPFWTANIRVETPTKQLFAIWDAWITARQGPRYTFLLGRAFRSRPRNGAVTDTGMSISSVNIATGTVTLSGAGTYTAKIGDMISYATAAGGWYIGTVLEEATAVAGAVALKVWPTPLAAAVTPRPRRFEPFGEFSIDGKVSKSETHTPNYIEFSAKQVIRITGGPASALTSPLQDVSLPSPETIVL